MPAYVIASVETKAVKERPKCLVTPITCLMASFRRCCCRSATTSPSTRRAFPAKHLRDVAATDGISAITINAHSTEGGVLQF